MVYWILGASMLFYAAIAAQSEYLDQVYTVITAQSDYVDLMSYLLIATGCLISGAAAIANIRRDKELLAIILGIISGSFAGILVGRAIFISLVQL